MWTLRFLGWGGMYSRSGEAGGSVPPGLSSLRCSLPAVTACPSQPRTRPHVCGGPPHTPSRPAPRKTRRPSGERDLSPRAARVVPGVSREPAGSRRGAHAGVTGAGRSEGRRGLTRQPRGAQGPARVSGELARVVLGSWDVSGPHPGRLTATHACMSTGDPVRPRAGGLGGAGPLTPERPRWAGGSLSVPGPVPRYLRPLSRRT